MFSTIKISVFIGEVQEAGIKEAYDMIQKEQVYEYIRNHYGVNEETIAKDLNLDMVDLTEILRELNREGKIRRVHSEAG